MTVAGLPVAEFLGAAVGGGVVAAVNAWVVDPLRTKRIAKEAATEAAQSVVKAHADACVGRQFLQPIGADLGAGK